MRWYTLEVVYIRTIGSLLYVAVHQCLTRNQPDRPYSRKRHTSCSTSSSTFATLEANSMSVPSSVPTSYPDLPDETTTSISVRQRPTSALLGFVNEITDSGAVRDGFKLIVVGGILEASRRGLGLLLKQVYQCTSYPIYLHKKVGF